MQIRVSEIPDDGLRLVDPGALGGVYPDPAWTFDAVDLLVERRGEKVAIAGRFEATAQLVCGRCLETFATPVAPEVDLLLVPHPTGRQGQIELAPRRPRGRLLPGGCPRRRGSAPERDRPGLADEAALPRGLPRALPGVRRQPQPHRVPVRDARDRPAPGTARGAPAPPIGRSDRCRCPSADTRARAVGSVARTTSSTLPRSRSVPSAASRRFPTTSAHTAATTGDERSSRPKAPRRHPPCPRRRRVIGR